jgi:hypothetical protein
MFGWRLVRDSELALQAQLNETRIASLAADLRVAKEYSAKCERLIEHERERIDVERERADRIADGRFQADGLPAVSDTVLREQRAQEAVIEDKRAKYMNELMQIYSETESDLLEDGAEPLPEELAAIVK